jgi:hypothetical protein
LCNPRTGKVNLEYLLIEEERRWERLANYTLENNSKFQDLST